MKKFLLLISVLATALSGAAQTVTPLVHFDFSSLTDASGAHTATLCQGAALAPYADGGHVLSLGADGGYLDFGEDFGDVIASLDGS